MRKIIQVAYAECVALAGASETDEFRSEWEATCVALCDDGSVWWIPLVEGGEKRKWCRLPDIPQG